ncbi:hypothetical protein CJU73_02240 [Pseudomonas fragi]|nr:hypothetical protein CJU73_02240 [Pseudomonas fragi]
MPVMRPALLGLLLVFTGQVHAAAETAIEPAALQALERMGSYLRSLKQFGVEARSQTDQVLENGQTVEFRHTTQLLAQQPDKLKVSVDNQGGRRTLYYDGKRFTLYQSPGPYYASAPAPANINALIDLLNTRYGIELPLADLFRWNASTAQQGGLRSAVLIGSDTLDGQRCDHYALRQDDIDWQLWLRQGEQPLPCRLTITRRDIPEHPRHSVDYAWQLKPALSATSFEFDPPHGAQEVPLQWAPSQYRLEAQP